MSMDIFRLPADLLHLFAFFILPFKIFRSRSCEGISGKSQILFSLTYTTRYIDLLCNFVSVYNSCLKVLFLLASYLTVELIYIHYRASYDRRHDTFRIEFLLVPALILAFLFNYEFSALEITWAFSEYLESVAILPQMFMIFKIGDIERYMLLYLVVLGTYKALYIVHWVYRYNIEGYYDIISIAPGIVYTSLYCVFLCVYKCVIQTRRNITEKKIGRLLNAFDEESEGGDDISASDKKPYPPDYKDLDEDPCLQTSSNPSKAPVLEFKDDYILVPTHEMASK